MRLTATFAFAVALLGMASPVLAQGAPDTAVVGTKQFEMKELTNGLEGPWEIGRAHV